MHSHRFLKLVSILAGVSAITSAAQPVCAQGQGRDVAAKEAVAGVPAVPRDLKDWKVSIANVGLREVYRPCRTGPAADVNGNGVLVLRKQKSSEFGVQLQLTDEDREKLFSTTRAVINGTYLAGVGREYPTQYVNNDVDL